MFNQLKNITLKDIVQTGIYDGVDFDKKREPGEVMKLLDQGNQILKDYFICWELDRIKEQHNKIDPEFNLITTDYFKNEIDNMLTVIASRTVKPGPEEVTEMKNNWLFKGYITWLDFKGWEELYPVFEELYREYNRPDWQIELNIIGGITEGHMLVSTDKIQQWRTLGVLIEPWGFDESHKLISFTDLLIQSNEQLKKEANEIREKGKTENIHEARILKLDKKGKQLFSQLFY